MSGGYADDEDHGQTIIYAGQGGQGTRPDPLHPGKQRKVQIRDQSWLAGPNKALRKSFELKCPVRLIRGAGLKNDFSPYQGYRYDGLYHVIKIEQKATKNSGAFKMCLYTLQQDETEGAWYRVPLYKEEEAKGMAEEAELAAARRLSVAAGPPDSDDEDEDLKPEVKQLEPGTSVSPPKPEYVLAREEQRALLKGMHIPRFPKVEPEDGSEEAQQSGVKAGVTVKTEEQDVKL
ncbi:hypothetical protein HGRIS_000521 [Hohenbuehelia grisea]|uniref:YDG domain-containing protein n=1 Tax=Hohenbuehelia grisea TaxID=104357 RepID=A0ABR3JRF8_9AGAR